METVEFIVKEEKTAILNALALSVKSLLSDVDFYEDEAKAIEILFQKKQRSSTTNAFVKRLEEFKKQKVCTLNSLFRHQSNLKATIQNLMQLSVAYLTEQHYLVENDLEQLKGSFETLKLEFLKTI